MKIRLLSQFFDPEPTLKGLTFAKGLQDRGHEVRVITGFPNYPSGRLAEGYQLRPHATEWMDEVRVDRVWLYPSHDRSSIRRAANYGSFALTSLIQGSLDSWRPDLTWVHHPPPTAALAAVSDKRLRKVPFCLEIQDLWPDTLKSTGMIHGGRLLDSIERAMGRIYREASSLICISEGFDRVLSERGVPAGKLKVLRNWADERRLTAMPEDDGWARKVIDLSDTNILYAGNMGPAQALGSVIQAFARVTGRAPQVKFHMVGDGIDAGWLQALAAQECPGRVTFHGRQSMGRVAAIASLCDFGIVHLKRDPLFEITIPSKIQANLFLGLPLVAAVRGDGARLVLEAGAGLLAQPENPESIADAMLALVEWGEAGRRSVGAAARSYYMNNLSVAAGLDRYEALFSELVG